MAWTPQLISTPALGFDTYLDISHINRAATIKRLIGDTNYTVYYCDGHQKVIKQFPTLAAAQTYLTNEVLAGD